MTRTLTQVFYLRKKEKKSMLLAIILLTISSFADEAYLLLRTKIQEQPSVKIQSKSILYENENSPNSSQSGQSIRTLDTVKTNMNEDAEIASSLLGDTTEIHSPKTQSAPLPRKPLEPLVASKEETRPQPFNPNVVSIEQLKSVGVSDYAAKNWVKFVQAGAKLHSRADLEKIFGLESETIERIIPLVMFPKKQPKYKKPQLIPFDINTGSASDFASIPGIGKILSERIVKFRDKLGGFHDPLQLTEVYGIEDSIIIQKIDYLDVEVPVKKINVNILSIEELSLHPYCTYHSAKLIANFRTQHGAFTKAQDLLEIRALDEQWVEKIKPYLIF